MTIETLVSQALHTADADQRLAAADAEFLTVFLSLTGAARAARWRGLDDGSKFRLVARRLEQLGHDWMPSDVAAQIARYDERYAAGPVDAAIEGALERLALEHANAARLAQSSGDKAGVTEERRQATAYTNALVQYRNGVRPTILASRARLIPSSTAGQSAHLLTMDGDWVCSCKAGASMHWPIALVIGLEGAHDDMERFDDGDVSCDPPGEGPSLGDDEGDTLPARTPIPHAAAACAWLAGHQQLSARLSATAQYLETLRAAQRPARVSRIGSRLAAARRVYLEAA